MGTLGWTPPTPGQQNHGHFKLRAKAVLFLCPHPRTGTAFGSGKAPWRSRGWKHSLSVAGLTLLLRFHILEVTLAGRPCTHTAKGAPAAATEE